MSCSSNHSLTFTFDKDVTSEAETVEYTSYIENVYELTDEILV